MEFTPLEIVGGLVMIALFGWAIFRTIDRWSK